MSYLVGKVGAVGAMGAWPFDDIQQGLQQAGGQIQQAGGQIIQAGQAAAGQVKDKFGPKAAPEKEKSWDDAANELKGVLEMARRQSQVENVQSSFEVYAGVVMAFVAGDLSVLTKAALAGDQLAAVKPALLGRTEDIKGRMYEMAKAAVEGKMAPPAGGGYSLSQVSDQVSKLATQVQAKGLTPAVLATGAGILGLGLVAYMAMRKKKS